MDTLYNFLFIALPYAAIIVFIGGSLYRYVSISYQYSSLSSQFLEAKQLFLGTVPFHFGIIVIFLGHLVAFLCPRWILLWNGHPLRLVILEVSAFAFGLSVLFGLGMLLFRRITHPRIRMVTTPMDIFIELLLLVEIVFGCWIALGYRWGSIWFATDLSPYLWSIVKLNPDIKTISAMPIIIQLHVIFAFVILLLIPFTRLVHFLVIPINYIWRPYQQVIWYWNRKKIRNPKSHWSDARPKNT